MTSKATSQKWEVAFWLVPPAGFEPATPTAGGALALWADAPVEIAIPVALLIVLDIRICRSRRRT
ncbi:hypothetical protein ABT063_04965 [Streptomyces sp. NPDC002838]|uniref:hypothetical protein n=1 Tax=Streptomyces sp. NPDC002838 TaxID=3154436 RepID=UPI00332D7B6F